MVKTKLPVHVHRGSTLLNEQIVMLGENHIKKWRIPPGRPVLFRFGCMKREIQIIAVARLAGIRVSEELAHHFGFQHGMQLLAQYKPAALTFRVGPLIGVLVSRVYARTPDRLFGAMTAFCQELVEACHQHGAHAFFFTPDDLPAEGAQTITGWNWNGGWSKRAVPFPDVVYNRLTSRRYENNPSVQHFMKEVKSHCGAVVFNEKYLDKTEVFDALRAAPGLPGYLPESHAFKNFAQLKAMCGKYPAVFLKPITGSLGQGIIRITRQGDGTFLAQTTGLNGARRQSFATIGDLFTAISGKIRQRRYQIQQGLRLIETNERPIDFRALVQRDGSGEWTVTSIVARIAGNNNFVSNLARGGSLSTVMEAVGKANLAPQLRGGINARMHRAALEIAKGLEQHIPAHFAELGIDLALDQQGRIWLLEVNSKPSKDDNSPLASGKIRPSVRKLVQYSQYLAKF